MATVHFYGLKANVQPGEKLIDVSRREHAPIPFGCQNGICGTCLSKVKKGMENLSPPEKKEQDTLAVFAVHADTHRLVCQCKLAKDGEVEITDP